jgi:hypothetical protein
MASKMITLAGYGVTSANITIVKSEIVCFWEIEFNGRSGVEIQLSNGKTVRVNECLWKIKSLLEE